MARIKSTPAKCVPSEATWERAWAPYTCHVCSREFSNGHQLGGHKRSHRRPGGSSAAEPLRRSRRKASARARLGLKKQLAPGKNKKVVKEPKTESQCVTQEKEEEADGEFGSGCGAGSGQPVGGGDELSE